MRVSPRVVPLFLYLVACADSTPTTPTPPTSAAATTYVVSGTVTETVNGASRPLANHDLNLWVWETQGLPAGVTQRRTWRPSATDGNGRYMVNVPSSRVIVSVGDKRQPCLASASVTRDTEINVQVFPAGRGVTVPAAAGPVISGFVYEMTPNGRRPLRGATAWLDISQDAYVANTETDESGRFAFCRVDAAVRMDVFAEGYQPYQYAELFAGTGDRSFEFEFRR